MASGRSKEVAFFLLRRSGLPYMIRELVQRWYVTILVYHKLSPEMADRHFAALRKHYKIITLRNYLDFRANPQRRLPRKALIVTLDDGHKSNYALKPVLEKHEIQATVFLCSGLVDTNRQFWFEIEMNDSVRQALKRVPDEKRLKVLAGLGFAETTEQSTRQALSAAEIEEMKPVVDFQSHTVYHPVLPQCSDQRAFDEMSASKLELESKLPLEVCALAYPNGDYSAREVATAEKCGYRCALTLDPGFNSRTTPAFQLKRICINDDAGLDELLVKASGIWGFLKGLVRSSSRSSDLSKATRAQLAVQIAGFYDENRK
jgi:poly-beta-1,6-N-acetyl-D-glucosamine N-deacetylase